MKRRRLAAISAGLFFLTISAVAGIVYNRSLTYLRRAEEQPGALWIAALKGFEGPVLYVGSEGEFSYFRTGTRVFGRYKARTSRIHLPRIFPIGEGDPYQVTHEMVPQY